MRVRKVLKCVSHFMGSIGIFIQSNPEISSLVVGGVNCILTVSTCSRAFYSLGEGINIPLFLQQLVLGYIEFFESLTDMMERIGSHLSYLSECSSAALQNVEKIQDVRTEFDPTLCSS